MVFDYVEVMGGFRSALYAEFCEMVVTAFLAARARHRELVLLVEMMRGATFPCFLGPGSAAVSAPVAAARDDSASFQSLNSQTMSASYSAGARVAPTSTSSSVAANALDDDQQYEAHLQRQTNLVINQVKQQVIHFS